MKDTSQWRWRPKRFLALAVITSLVPLPVLAGEGYQPAPATQTLSASAAKIVAREVLSQTRAGSEAVRSGGADLKAVAYFNGRAGVVAPAAAIRAEQSGAPDTGSAGFFKTGAGVAVVAVLAAGVGYALYSTQHDRIHSAGKK